MQEAAPEDDDREAAARSRGLIASALVALVAMIVVLWWTTRYGVLVKWLGEWQFAHLGYYFPSLTVVLAVAIVAVPLTLVVAWVRRRRFRRIERQSVLTPLERVAIARNGALRGRMFFLMVAGVAALWAVGAALTMIGLPSGTGPVTTIRGDERATVEGPARFAAGRTLGRVGRLVESVGLATRVTYVAPVQPVGGRTGSVRFFTEMERLAGPEPRFVPLGQGILKARGLPGELVGLYRDNGSAIVDHPSLLVRDYTWLQWRPIVLAVQLALLALVALGAAMLLQRQARRLERFKDAATRP